MSARKLLHLGTRWNPLTDREEPVRFVGWTDDGHVGFTVAGVELVNRIEISHGEATDLVRELLHATNSAEAADRDARGWNEWVTRPLPGGLFEVRHRGEVEAFRPIKNSPRRDRAPAPGRRGRTATPWRCTACKSESADGATMYVAVKRGEPGHLGGVHNWGFGGVRLCQRCVRPELNAALLGAALAGEGSS